MFTGIIQTMGTIESARGDGTDLELELRAAAFGAGLAVGDSVAIDGVCQTVIRRDDDSFAVHAVAETLRVTTLGRLRPGTRVNLEAALRAGQPLGGHFVSGHVDGLGSVAAREAWGESVRFRFDAPAELVSQLVPKGSVAIDGISLTVGPELARDAFEVFLIPHTLEATTLGEKEPGAAVNLETDLLGKHVARLLEGRLPREGSTR